jgi:hypothetical protein
MKVAKLGLLIFATSIEGALLSWTIGATLEAIWSMQTTLDEAFLWAEIGIVAGLVIGFFIRSASQIKLLAIVIAATVLWAVLLIHFS